MRSEEPASWLFQLAFFTEASDPDWLSVPFQALLMVSPSGITRISQTMHRRSTSGLSEHSPFDSFSGSIGMTCCGKYTEVPRSCASRSSGEPGVT